MPKGSTSKELVSVAKPAITATTWGDHINTCLESMKLPRDYKKFMADVIDRAFESGELPAGTLSDAMEVAAQSDVLRSQPTSNLGYLIIRTPEHSDAQSA